MGCVGSTVCEGIVRPENGEVGLEFKQGKSYSPKKLQLF